MPEPTLEHSKSSSLKNSHFFVNFNGKNSQISPKIIQSARIFGGNALDRSTPVGPNYLHGNIEDDNDEGCSDDESGQNYIVIDPERNYDPHQFTPNNYIYSEDGYGNEENFQEIIIDDVINFRNNSNKYSSNPNSNSNPNPNQRPNHAPQQKIRKNVLCNYNEGFQFGSNRLSNNPQPLQNPNNPNPNDPQEINEDPSDTQSNENYSHPSSSDTPNQPSYIQKKPSIEKTDGDKIVEKQD
jgi:hypothetical protein